MELVEVKGITKHVKKAVVLTDALMESKRKHNSIVVRRALGKA